MGGCSRFSTRQRRNPTPPFPPPAPVVVIGDAFTWGGVIRTFIGEEVVVVLCFEIDDDRDEMRFCFDNLAKKHGEHFVRTGVLPTDGVQDDNRQWTSKGGER